MVLAAGVSGRLLLAVPVTKPRICGHATVRSSKILSLNSTFPYLTAMKSFFPTFLLLLTLQLSACGGGESQGGNGIDSTQTGADAEAAADENAAISSWEGQSVRSAPGSGAGEWVATLAFGEKLELMGESSTDEKSKKTFAKIRLLDGKDGWVREDMIQKSGTLAAISEPAQVYARPGISNIKDEVLESTTLVILGTKQEDFVEFTAQNKGSARSKGWLLGDKGYTTAQLDITVAILIQKARAEKNQATATQKLRDILRNSTYAASNFIDDIEVMVQEVETAEALGDDQLMIQGDNVNVRSEPKVGENKLFQLANGVVCAVLEVGNYETIGQTSDYWYQISASGRVGWVFGAFTSKAGINYEGED
jgi:uncharacterized protein YgiM (DUF1202 family)